MERHTPTAVILGVDPGLASTGFGAIMCHRRPTLLRCGHIRTSPAEDMSCRLRQIYTDISALIGDIRPSLVAIENVFSLVRYPRAGILLGAVLGVIYLAVGERNLPLQEIAPREIKSALAGYGAATKQQMRDAVQRLLEMQGPMSSHAADAIAVAVTAFYRSTGVSQR